MNTEDDEFARIEREQAMRGVPDAIHHTDTSETLEYITGWNDCRQAMLEQPAQQKPLSEKACNRCSHKHNYPVAGPCGACRFYSNFALAPQAQPKEKQS